jgi:hypothetical protein
VQLAFRFVTFMFKHDICQGLKMRCTLFPLSFSQNIFPTQHLARRPVLVIGTCVNQRFTAD